MASADALVARPELHPPPKSVAILEEPSQPTAEVIVHLERAQPITGVREENAPTALQEFSAVLERGIGVQEAPLPEAGGGEEPRSSPSTVEGVEQRNGVMGRTEGMQMGQEVFEPAPADDAAQGGPLQPSNLTHRLRAPHTQSPC